MPTESGVFKFRKDESIGANAAEQDERFLSTCFVETGAVNAIRDLEDHRRIVLGRTGSGKSQGNRILISGKTAQNAFQEVFVPAGLESFASDASF
ncbi:MAG: hypothetical protein AB7U73_07180 [Pirellulales bacterium]